MREREKRSSSNYNAIFRSNATELSSFCSSEQGGGGGKEEEERRRRRRRRKWRRRRSMWSWRRRRVRRLELQCDLPQQCNAAELYSKGKGNLYFLSVNKYRERRRRMKWRRWRRTSSRRRTRSELQRKGKTWRRWRGVKNKMEEKEEEVHEDDEEEITTTMYGPRDYKHAGESSKGS